MNFLAQKRKKILLQESLPSSRKENPFDDFYYKEIALLTGAGGYRVDFLNKTSFIDPEGRRILKVPTDFVPSLSKNLMQFYAPSEHLRVMNTFSECQQGVPFATTVKMLTYTGEEFWAKAIGKPMRNANGQIIGIQGVFQDITSEKNKALALESSLKTIESQNARLLNYAHLVSHNLRSHASNLTLALELLKEVENKKDEAELVAGLSTISEGLCSTVDHLSEIVSIQDKCKAKRQRVSFEESLNEVKKGLRSMISDNRAEIFTDFSEAPYVEYLPSSLVLILSNLLKNAIQFRHKERNPVIDIYSLENEGKVSLVVKDNGVGFNSTMYKDCVFNLYETFNEGIDTLGTGLFTVKNQVESLGGSIAVESEPEKGTTFRISF